MQVKEIDINTGKIKRYGICKKKVQNLIFRWSYHSDLLYKKGRSKKLFQIVLPKIENHIAITFHQSLALKILLKTHLSITHVEIAICIVFKKSPTVIQETLPFVSCEILKDVCVSCALLSKWQGEREGESVCCFSLGDTNLLFYFQIYFSKVSACNQQQLLPYKKFKREKLKQTDHLLKSNYEYI